MDMQVNCYTRKFYLFCTLKHRIMKRSTLCLLLLCAVYCGCKDSAAGGSIAGALGKAALFNTDSVRHFLDLTPEAKRDSSQKIFLKALDLLKNKNKPAASVALFLEALSIYPNATAYYELGNAWLENSNPEQALDAYKMAELMDYSPWSHVLFKKACCYADKDESAEMFEYLSYAIENGFVDRNKIFTNAHLAKYKEYNQLTEVYNRAMAGNGNADAILWEGYSKQFGQSNFPFTIDSGTLKSIGKPVLISYDYEKYVTEMRDHKFSRDVGNEFFYFTKVTDRPAFKTVIYGSKSAYEGDLLPAYYLLASFAGNGRLLDKKLVSGTRALDDPFKECTFSSDTTFEIKEYKNTYEKNVETEGYDNNRIVKRDLVATNKFMIDSTGKFTALP
jgi:tetratricopeptide (TPR) repeat protein